MRGGGAAAALGGGGGGMPSLPKGALPAGFDMNDPAMAKQAEQLWSHLDELSKSDPDGYKAFIEKQMKDHEKSTPSLMPEPGFVAMGKREMDKLATGKSDEKDDSPSVLKIPELQMKLPEITDKVFINFVQSNKIQKPHDFYDRPVSDDIKNV